MNGLRITTVGTALSVLFAAAYAVCLAWTALAGGAMYQSMQQVFPGFGWSIGGVVLGLGESVLYGFFAAAVFVPTYNYLRRREQGSAAPAVGAPRPPRQLRPAA